MNGMYRVVSSIDLAYDAMMRFIMFLLAKLGKVYVRPQAEGFAPHEAMDIPDEEMFAPSAFRSVHEILNAETYAESDTGKQTIMYAGRSPVLLYKNPTVEFDGEIAKIPYGEMVMMLEARGRFFQAAWGAQKGWVLREDLVDRAAFVYPAFVMGEKNDAEHRNTTHTRGILNDVFGGARSELPLQAGEYILYRLWRKSIRINWPPARPRLPGVWHKILKGVPGVHVNIVPKTGSIMEYLINPEIGHLAYVEAVFPDNSITISEVNYPDSGIYSERTLLPEEWRELRPVFIQIR
jgi:hypothetical protein